MRVNNFTVVREMGRRNLDIRLAPLSNILNLRRVKAGTEVTIGVAGDLLAALSIEKRFYGGLLLADRKQFDEVARDLADEIRFRIMAEDYNGHAVAGQTCCCDRCAELTRRLREAAGADPS